ncbi:unnamed protein product [Zymoseptoria tritici ST99CH_1E4]|uniref:RRM domain-containing protein n=1 Tax=Zymoseptoria tritici ST99CH_1E4 TaxID=1276532 RepID=A0A2H1H5R8_ZYMTR|nr:unnamed protein product [Zymoseptoria tritici ST99CH_1E4]
MSTDTKTTKKRKSGDDVVPPTKKVKVATTSTRTTRSADAPAPPPAAEAPAPLKSALKKKDTTKKAEKAEVKPAKAKKDKKSAAAAAAQDIISDDESAGTALTTAQTDALFAGFTDSEDEEAEDSINVDADAIDVAKLPKAPKPKALTGATTSSDPESTPGVVYISRIPHGFYEPQMAAYFSQFGPISAIRLARNRKTGKSQHFAFIQFESASVADIVARTMDKYLLFGHLLQARTIPLDQVKEGLFSKKGAKGGKVRPRNRIEGGLLKRGTDRETWGKRVEKEEKRRSGKGKKLEKLGYEFEMPGVKGVESVPVQQQAVEGAVEGAIEGKPAVDPKEVIVDEVEEKKIEEKKIEEKNVEEKKGGKKEKRKAKSVDAAAEAAPKKKTKKAKVAA